MQLLSKFLLENKMFCNNKLNRVYDVNQTILEINNSVFYLELFILLRTKRKFSNKA